MNSSASFSLLERPVWVYYTWKLSQQALSWRDEVMIQYFRQQGVDVHVRTVLFDEDIALSEDPHVQRIIFSNLGRRTYEHVQSYFWTYTALLLSDKCRQLGIHYTYLNCELEEGTLQQDGKTKGSYIRRFMASSNPRFSVYLNLWMLVHEDVETSENMLYEFVAHSHKFSVDNAYYVSVLRDILPILFDIIKKGKGGSFELANPTPIMYGQILRLYKEYTNVEIDVTHPSTSMETGVYGTHPPISTDRLEKEYFILPSYQSIQRLFKWIRKTNMIVSDVDLTKKTCILVTGGYGFIGSNLVHYLYHSLPKCTIVNVDRLDYCSRRENLDDLIHSERVKCYEIDLCETEKLETIMREHQVQYVMHLAAQSHVDNSFNNSLQFSRDNVYGTHSLLEASKNHGKLIRFLHVSTDEIYGETLQMDPFDENVLPNPTNPYAATKVGAEYIVKSYFHCFELPIIMIRGNNVYGPRQYPEKMIPKFITSIYSDEPCTVAGNGLMQRNFVYVEDVCAGLVTVLEKGKIDEIYNIGSHDEKTVISIARTLIKTMKGEDADMERYIRYVKDRYYNDFRYSINSEKIRGLGWAPKVMFEEGLLKTIRFYTENISLYNNNDDDDDDDDESRSRESLLRDEGTDASSVHSGGNGL